LLCWPIVALVGGETERLVVALMLFDAPDFLVLGEPANYFFETKEMLTGSLSPFEGTMLFVVHDQHFLAALSNRVLELTPEGIHQHGGGYAEYWARTGWEAPRLHA
jgi:ATPase subunit of ABC transporter with duplicated ATPase domains